MGRQYLLVSGNRNYVGRYYEAGGVGHTSQWVHRQGMFFSCDGRMWRIYWGAHPKSPGKWIQLRSNNKLTGFWQPDLIVTGPHEDLDSKTTTNLELVWLGLCLLLAVVVGMASYGLPAW